MSIRRCLGLQREVLTIRLDQYREQILDIATLRGSFNIYLHYIIKFNFKSTLATYERKLEELNEQIRRFERAIQ